MQPTVMYNAPKVSLTRLRRFTTEHKYKVNLTKLGGILAKMPTQHVEPQAKERLGDVAEALLKARKVVVVTGAGISTNSGIPDFRSENGLYSLIQAQFDAVSRQARQNDPSDNEEGLDGTAVAPRPVKRRKMSGDDVEDDVKDSITVKMETNNTRRDMIEVQPISPPLCTASEGAGKDTASTVTTTATATAASITITTTQMVVETGFSTPKSKVATMSAVEPTTSPLSSPPGEDFIIPPSAFRYCTRKRLTDASLPLSSSPLSSPPPVLFDAFIPSSPSEASSSSRRSSTSPPSEADEDDEEPSASQYSSSQSSSGGRNALPNMKGKDLFDANIWSDPVRTSVFYTFATSLRQKIRSAEPTTSHRFISHLRDRGKLVRCYTQNIDQIEEKVGLSTRLQDGPGSRGRFSRRSTAGMNQLSKMVEEANPCSNEQQPVPENPNQSDTSTDSSQQSQDMGADASDAPGADELLFLPSDESKSIPKALKKQLPRSGVECVFLHGSLHLLRCFLCGRVCSWDEHDRETETLSGQQPECPHCVGATVAREERGKRALGVGKLRPDIVLYGEEHPSSHLISPIITHDLGLYPDMLLILGTSLRVHGLKVMVREFAKAVHSKGGKVIFVNFTKPPESIWGDIIDYWVQWDCDAWVDDLQLRIPKLWQEPELPRPRKKRESSGTSEESTKEEGEEEEEKKKKKKKKKKKPPAANPAALRDTKVTGAYWTCKVIDELHRITGHPGAKAGSSKHTSAAAILCTSSTPTPTVALAAPAAPAAKLGPEIPHSMAPQQDTRAKQKRSRKSAPGALERAQRPSSTLNPNHGRWRKKMADPATQKTQKTPAAPVPMSTSSILSSVKENPRIRKRKMIDGEEVPAPSVGKRRNKHEPKLPPMLLSMTNLPPSLHEKPWAMEPESKNSPPSGPLSSLSPNVRSAKVIGKPHASFHHHDAMVCLLKEAPEWACTMQRGESRPPAHQHDMSMRDEASAAMTLAGLRNSPVLMTRSVPPHRHGQGNLEGELMSWGSSWSCNM
ncbi:hypothetical protein C2857_004862 [Epichloe festucae Fl1]|uniref:Deacetylase sirtuin-type domain-containing protein n=1 Tax=Epichloe festucae (strain Fl1) TaxID=877507 RepID=A0A7S9KPH0_EPIFF|nr:hypothetical protein C2857_004862 [Epichloe festucae Fl1]